MKTAGDTPNQHQPIDGPAGAGQRCVDIVDVGGEVIHVSADAPVRARRVEQTQAGHGRRAVRARLFRDRDIQRSQLGGNLRDVQARRARTNRKDLALEREVAIDDAGGVTVEVVVVEQQPLAMRQADFRLHVPEPLIVIEPEIVLQADVRAADTAGVDAYLGVRGGLEGTDAEREAIFVSGLRPCGETGQERNENDLDRSSLSIASRRLRIVLIGEKTAPAYGLPRRSLWAAPQ